MSEATRPTVAAALSSARAQGLDRLDAQLLLCAVLSQPRSWLIGHDQDVLTADQSQAYDHLAARRAQGEPLAYLLGEKEFHGLMLQVGPGVLVPRPDTEVLVEWALELLPLDKPCQVLDLGTGSGAIALALQHQRPRAQVTAVDASPAALAVAQANARRHDLPVRFLEGSWLAPVAGQMFDLIVSNPPYIAEGDPHLADLQHEPLEALTAGPDGLADLKQIIPQARGSLRPGGWLLLEHGYDQRAAVQALMRQAGWQQVNTRFDLGGRARCTGGHV